jgi:hypothetical protein
MFQLQQFWKAANAFEMYKLIFGKQEYVHRIGIDFIGLPPKPHPEASDVLSVAEFMHSDDLSRRAYFSEEVNIIYGLASQFPK